MPIMTANLQEERNIKLTEADRPMVSIGLPVYNGEAYLRQALDSILSQTYGEFELVISDNASNENTEMICREYAAADARIRYHRQTRNRGVTWNFRRVVLLSSGKYFLWTSHDDLLAPNYVESCVAILEHNPNVVLCYSDPVNIDEAGKRFEPGCPLKADLRRPHQRFRELIGLNHNCVALFGMMRADVLKKTSIHGDFSDGDRCVLVELALRGDYYRIPEHLFFHREHSGRFTQQYPSRQDQTRRANPDQSIRFVFPHFRIFQEYTLAVHRAPLSWAEHFWCYLHLLNWVRWYRGRFWSDIKFSIVQLIQSRSQFTQSESLATNDAGTDPLPR
jgi:glycosyltransferase involved in cell wall biosynthesis